ncbi:PDDEXK nuclease domain-containing protein [Mesorhizobium sp. M1A.F.Ca.IN.020.30.1.1]|uniref:PDDEXK nuclease domain-containing protein n=1 Tax=Mesorhizobium sp. M1A.F.Ca.IN.020.30.1.1 TaxID=2496762 RepID=UPI0019D4C68C|nr:PDDEXK nuclease domain-containing protein [Mesorhizobium sp. M1A.F.Ca.IN.020.30.1.1]
MSGKPEFVGKMNFYLAAVDAKLVTDGDSPSIGLILCRGKNGLVVEYALRDVNKPMAVSEYKVLPPKIASALPSPTSLRRVWMTLTKLMSHNPKGPNQAEGARFK